MFVKPRSNLNHVEPARVENDRGLASLVRVEVLLPLKVCYNCYKFRIELVEECHVKRLHAQIELIGTTPDPQKPGFGYAQYSRIHAL